MASTIKVTNINTPDGTGNIIVDRPLSGSGASLTALPAANLTGTIAGARLPDPLPAISGASLTNLPVQVTADNSITLAKMEGGTDGQIITYDASGDPVRVGPGSSGQVLTSAGAGAPPTFAAAAAGGKLLAMFHSTGTFGSTTIGTTNGTWYDTAVTLTFTPTSTASKFFVYYGLGTSVQDSGTDGGYGTRIKKVQGATTYPSNLQDWASGNIHSGLYLYPGGLNATRVNWYYTFSGVDADAHTTASLAYTVQFGQYNISTLNVGNYYAARSQIVVLEVSTA